MVIWSIVFSIGITLGIVAIYVLITLGLGYVVTGGDDDDKFIMGYIFSSVLFILLAVAYIFNFIFPNVQKSVSQSAVVEEIETEDGR